MNEPIFSSCIISRPLHPAALYRKVPAFAVAMTVYVVGGAGILLAPLFVLEMDSPPKARVTAPEDRLIVFQPPGGGGKRTAGMGPRIRKGGGNPAHQPAAVPLAPPEADHPLDSPAPGNTTAGNLVPGPGHPAGDGTSPDGLPAGCPDCSGDGPGGFGGPGDAPPEPIGGYDEWDERITTPATLIPGTRALPAYPDLARRAGVQGSLILLVVIGADGRVGAIEVLRSPDSRFGFDLAAIEAVKQWRYNPALMEGRPVAVKLRVFVEFTLAR